MTQQEKDELVELAVAKALELVPTSEAKAFLEGLPIGFAKTVGIVLLDSLMPELAVIVVRPNAEASGRLAL